jgi:hypothetical protein
MGWDCRTRNRRGSQERLPEAVRFTYTVRYVSASTTGPPIVRIDVGARAFAGAAELETPPISVESPPGGESRVIPDRSRPRVWQVAWSCAEDWERCLAHHIKAGQVRSGFRVIVPDGRGFGLLIPYAGPVESAAIAVFGSLI